VGGTAVLAQLFFKPKNQHFSSPAEHLPAAPTHQPVFQAETSAGSLADFSGPAISLSLHVTTLAPSLSDPTHSPLLIYPQPAVT